VEPEVAELRIGEKIDFELAKKELGKHIHEFDGGEKWFIPYFVEFQYGELKPAVNAHRSVIEKLRKKNLLIVYEQFVNCSLTVMDMDMDKDKDKDKEELLNDDKIDNLWQRSFGRMPKLPERELTETWIKKYGFDKTLNIMKTAVLQGFRNIATLNAALDNEGNIKPRGQPNKQNGKDEDKESIYSRSIGKK
jgi:hypothetical protein